MHPSCPLAIGIIPLCSQSVVIYTLCPPAVWLYSTCSSAVGINPFCPLLFEYIPFFPCCWNIHLLSLRSWANLVTSRENKHNCVNTMQRVYAAFAWSDSTRAWTTGVISLTVETAGNCKIQMQNLFLPKQNKTKFGNENQNWFEEQRRNLIHVSFYLIEYLTA